MLKSLIYKEWIKTRWFFLLVLVLGMAGCGAVFLKVQHSITFNDAHKYWHFILFQNLLYFNGMKYIPLATGVLIALVQYIPEIVNKRIKLSFHLPLGENRVLLMMLGYGYLLLCICYGLIFALFLLLSSHFFPSEIVRAAVISVTPWFLAGFVAYALAALIVMETLWKYRMAYLLASAAFVLFFFKKSVAGGYAHFNWTLAAMTVALSTSLTFSAYRFRKGAV
ncbi:MAG: hypothetical protein CSA96_06830 [Bacteroidetes bacterium]|nr:MAG: hypothetical protein CSA96_06830 [Bacteroidota bacterium]